MTVNTNDLNELFQKNEDFENMELKDNSSVSIPDGKYQAMVERVEITRSESSGALMLKWQLRIIGPTHQGSPIWRYNMISNGENLRYLKQDLYTCGLTLQKLSDLPDRIDELLDVALEITKKTKDEFVNVYFRRKIALTPEQRAAIAGDRPPF